MSAGLWLQSYMDDIEDYWERGDGLREPPDGAPFHNTAVYGWDPLDPQLVTAARIASGCAEKPNDDLIHQLVEHHAARAALAGAAPGRQVQAPDRPRLRRRDGRRRRAWRRSSSSWAPTTRSAR